MSYVVYHIASTMKENTFETEGAAKRSTTCMNKKSMARYGENQYAYASLEDYNTKVVYMVERTNLMTQMKFVEPSNTPCYCSPAFESYYSM